MQEVSVTVSAWNCHFCHTTFADGDLYSTAEIKKLGLKIKAAIINYWFGSKPVCEDCGVARNIPKESE